MPTLQDDFDQGTLEASDLKANAEQCTPPHLPLTALQFELWQVVMEAVEAHGRKCVLRVDQPKEAVGFVKALEQERLAYRTVEILTAELVRRALP